MNRIFGLMVLLGVTWIGFGSPMYADDWTIEEIATPRVYWSSIGFLALDHQNNPHMAIASTTDYWQGTDGELRIASRVNDTWTFETVSNTESYFASASLAYDSQDRSAMICWTSDQIRYYFQVGRAWQSETIRNESICSDFNFSFDGQDRPHLVFLTATELVHAVRLNGIWTFQTVASDSQLGFPRATMGSDDVLRVIYTVDGALQYATIDGTGSSITTGSTGFTTIYATSSITLDDQNHPHIAFMSNGVMTYAHNDNGINWISETISSADATNLVIALDPPSVHVFSWEIGVEGIRHFFSSGANWQMESLYTDAIPYDVMVKIPQPGTTHIAMLNSSYNETAHLGELVYGIGNGTSWEAESVECVFKPGANLSFALDAAGHLHISHGYHTGSEINGFYSGYMTNQDGDWASTILHRSDIHDSASAVMSDGRPAIALSDGSNLRFAVLTDSQWDVQTVDTAEAIEGIDMHVNPAGLVGISYYRVSSGVGSVRYAYLQGGSWQIETVEPAEMQVYEAETILEIDSDHHAWISYYTNTDDRGYLLRFAQRESESIWNCSTFERPCFKANFDMKLNPEGRICFAYPCGSTIFLSTWTGTQWEQDSMDVSPETYRVKIDYDAYKGLHIIALDEADGSPFMHYYRNNGSWSADTFEIEAVPAEFKFDIGIDAQNVLHIVWSADEMNHGIFHAATMSVPPVFETGVTLEMPSHMFSPGDPCHLMADLASAQESPQTVQLFVILQIGSEYWFNPSWTHDVGYETIQLLHGRTQRMIIPPFVWPDTGSASIEGVRFWGGMMDESMTELLGGYQGISEWVFGFGPR